MTKKHDIMWLDTVDSTNDEARRHISDIDNLSVLSALEQTAGRGQRGNRWTSRPGENLTFSIVLKSPVLMADDHFALNEIAALSVTDFLSIYGIKAEIKWPNDIYVDGRKICGILIENSFRGKSISTSIIGIGLNINQRNFDVNLPNPTSMVLCSPTSGSHWCFVGKIMILIPGTITVISNKVKNLSTSGPVSTYSWTSSPLTTTVS